MLQRLHDAIKTNGESSERLAALARGYAHIGVETESLWSPAHKVFKARALLYAERLARQTKESPFSLWNRAYVRALVGRHQAALDDLALAAREPTDKASATGGKKPDWVKVIKAFCEFDSATLAKADQNARLRPLARYLKMFAEEFEYSFLLRTQSVAELRDVTPDCFRALELLAANSPLTADRNIREEAIRLFPTSLYRRTADMPGLADAAKSLCKTALADASHDNGNMDTEIRNRQQLIGLLEQSAGNPSRRTEPSWAALAALIRETGFLHAWRIVNLKKHRLGIQADATIDSLAPLVAQHPYRKYLDTHRNNNTAVSAAWKELAVSIDTSELELTEGTMLDSLGRTNRMFPENTFYDVAFFRLDPVYRDLAPLAIRTHNNYRSNHISILKEASPHSPQLAIAEILAAQQATDPALALANAPVWERRFNRNSSVLAELSELYIKFARDEAALRCAKREVELSPEVTPCLRLARLYKKQGDLDRWKATLDLYLQGQSYGLDHCDVRIEIANYYMEQKKWGLALPYAVLAADSWASRGLLTAVRCYDGMEDWKNAELYVRRCSERYEFSTDAYEWFFWCRRTGQGDAEAARRLARSYVNSLSASQVMRQPVLVATYQQLCGDLDGALQTLSATWNNTSDPWYALFAALVAHDLDRPDVRNMLLDQIARRGKNFQSNNRVREELIALAAMIAEQIAAGNDASFDQEKFEKLVQSARFGDRTNLQYFAGRFLARRGQIKLAKKHLLQATAAREVIVTWTLAATLLQEKAFAIEDGPE